MRIHRLVLLLTLLAMGGCATHSSRLAGFREAWFNARYQQADAEINHLIAKEAGVPVETVASSDALDPSIRVAKGDLPVLLMEKSMVLLARGKPQAARELLRNVRDELDLRYVEDNFGDYFAAALSDDSAITYSGADYEHIMIRVMLALCDLMAGGEDAYSYSLQVGEKQEEILKSAFGKEVEYQPRKQYQRVGIGAYLQGIQLESDLAFTEAEKAYQRLKAWNPDSTYADEALSRADRGVYAKKGHGVVHVFYLAGKGPYLGQRTSQPTTDAVRIAGYAATLVSGNIAPMTQARVPVPVVVEPEMQFPQLQVRVGPVSDQSEELMDVAQVARQQLDAMMPMILARAVLRRAVKATVSTTFEQAGRGTDKRKQDMTHMVAALGNLIWTASERADTRSWSALPASIQVARIEVPKGQQEVVIGGRSFGSLRILAGTETYILVLQPSLGFQPRVLCSRPLSNSEQVPVE